MSRIPRPLVRALSAGTVAGMLAMSLAACGGSEAASSSDCTPAHADLKTITQGELTVASYDYAPATILSGENVTGMEGDLIAEIAKLECLKVTVSTSGGAGAVIPSVQSKRVDIGSGNWLRTKERTKIVYMSTPLWSDPQAIVSKTGLTSDDLEGKMIGSVAGNLWNDSMSKWLGDKFKIYQDDESIYSDLKAGRIDALVASSASAKYRFKDAPIEGATVVDVKPNANVPQFASVGQVMLPSALDNDTLGKALDEDIKKLRENGTIKTILEKYGIDPSVGEPGAPSEL
ncbi:amino acid ABC transporter substrate-binding protein [Paenarthrobacter nitroguajacolicus]|uniref:Amino acid ABC transporter substrate-binding protein n=1 Tax=Paenarthrobacter nitroguajacolicus TaxID=211146 RepID=A0A558GN91_PAENT|nr:MULTISPECIES: ABC transporter substrate-binding protein [Paenarthrobacter]MCM0616885.1 transporter substrate-binding domain-containing protein [Paenarthrobacter sp. TYUT067]TVU58360.1 amino acid ABC transporter substrate-binding protein [Paenarthrobacter nitroguajacolicus]